MDLTLNSEIIQLHAEICGGLADANRIMILYELGAAPKNVTELCNTLNLPQSLVSSHLKILRERHMVETERHGTVIIYSLADSRLTQALDLLRAVMRERLAKNAALVSAMD
ncbi:MAG: metalloregulator ArsR/SmtB family transcription factor [Chloroflexota bacterium]